MAFFILLIYLFLTFIRPFELFPSLAPLHLIQVFGYIGVVLTLAAVPMTGISVVAARPLHLTMFFFFLLIVSVVVTQRWVGGAIVTFQDISPTIFLYLFTVINVSTVRRAGVVIGTMVTLCLLLVVLCHAALHYRVFEQILIMQQNNDSGVSIERARGVGFMNDPNDLGQTLVMAIPLAAAAWRKSRAGRNMMLVVLPILFLIYGIYLTRSRGAIVSLLAVFLIAARRHIGALLAPMLTGMAAIGLLALNFSGGRGFGSGDESVRNRLEAWSSGLQVLKLHPFIGVGFRNFFDHYRSTDGGSITAHNSFVIAFAELGIFGYLIWIAMLVVTRQELVRIQKLPVKTAADMTLQRYARATELAFYGLLVSGWFLSRTYVPTLYIVTALALALSLIARRSGAPLPAIQYGALFRKACTVGGAAIALIYLTVKLQVR